MWKLLLVAVVGLSVALAITLQRNVSLKYEVEFLTLSYELVHEGLDDVKKKYAEERVKYLQVREEFNKLKQVRINEKSNNNPSTNTSIYLE